MDDCGGICRGERELNSPAPVLRRALPLYAHSEVILTLATSALPFLLPSIFSYSYKVQSLMQQMLTDIFITKPEGEKIVLLKRMVHCITSSRKPLCAGPSPIQSPNPAY